MEFVKKEVKRFLQGRQRARNTPARNVHLVDHKGYMRRVINEAMRDVEKMGWWNLDIPEFSMVINEDVLHWPVVGTVYFRHGFTTSIQRLEISNSINQNWNWNVDGTAVVRVTGSLVMHDVVVGFDVESHINNIVHHSTATFRRATLTCNIALFKNMHTNEMHVTVDVSHPTSSNRLVFMPSDNITQVITALYNQNSTFTGITQWGPQIFEPIFLDVVTNKIEFPDVCYDCPVS
ncbi:uncharacterized protein LOC113514819 isoform X2 [Galleria mellonella]|uniref:Uncharacterized protein LOC113514819 isoform X2 n=1 Tax=Galleria mellonella TaxID=7137 RepID=A0ABM3MYJ7_GALME|nr:uncharacterized protein LOC113514819 isoform X2 [Galleria mellonella]